LAPTVVPEAVPPHAIEVALHTTSFDIGEEQLLHATVEVPHELAVAHELLVL